VERWLEKFAPSQVKFKLQDTIPEIVRTFAPREKEFLKALAGKIEEKDWNGDELQNLIYNLAQSLGIEGKKAFKLIYLSFLNQDSGPRAGYFLVSLPKDFVIKRLEEAGTL
ncbi:MAG: lysine--tRNA ligase, partial [Dictyoglomus sp.]